MEIKDYAAGKTALTMDIYPKLRARVHSNALKVTAFGLLPLNYELTTLAERDAKRAELRVLPLVGLLLIFVFGSLAGAAIPLATGLLAVTAGIAGTIALAKITPVLVYAKNIVVMVGLGVAIDYSLFILSRFREEMQKNPVPEALANTMKTTGRVVLFSGATVAIGLLGMMFLRASHVNSIGMAGAIVLAMALLYTTTFLPALLAVLGTRVDALKLPFINIDKRGHGGRFWHALATMIMAHPWRVLLPTALFLISLGVPFLHIRLGSTGVTGLPKTAEARQGWEQLHDDFPKTDTNPILVIVRYPEGSPLSAGHVRRLYDLSRWLAKLPAVNQVQSIVNLSPSINRSQYVELLSRQIDPTPEGLQLALKKTVGRHIVMLTAQTSLPAGGSEARNLVRTIRESHPPVEGQLMVTGESAFQLDLIEAIKNNSPYVVGLVVFITYVVLFLLLGSVLLPLKAVLMNILSISASYGALVWIFQEGHLARWLHFTPGSIEAMNPIMMFCILFGLSMDYEVLLLGRIRGEYLRTGDNTEAVALGLELTGRRITGAAAIMALVLFGFGFSDLEVIQTIGIGMGISIVMDATIVRCLLVPATMRLLGQWNWWAPRPMARVYEFFSLGERERSS